MPMDFIENVELMCGIALEGRVQREIESGPDQYASKNGRLDTETFLVDLTG